MTKFINKYRSIPVQMKASFWFLICAFLQRGISAITTPIFTRLLTTSEYGQYNVFNSWMSIITCLVSLNLYGGVYAQSLVKFSDRRAQIASSFQGLVATLAALWLIVYALFHQYFDSVLDISYPQGLMVLILIWSSSVFQLWAQEQRVLYKYKVLVGVTLLYSISAPVLEIILIKVSQDKVTAKILGVVIASIVSYTWMFFDQLRRGKSFIDKEVWKYALGLAIPLIPHYLSQMILNSSDRIMIGKMVDQSAAGIYSLAYSVSLIMTVFNTSLLSTIEPWVYQKIKAKELNKISSVAYPCFILIAGVNLLLILLAPEVIRIFAPAEYYEAIWVIPPIAMSVFFMFAYSFFAMFEFYFEKNQYIIIATLTGAVLNIILNYIFIKIFGYVAAGYTTLACYIIYAVMHYVFMRKICNEKLEGYKVYNIKIIITISVIFMCLGFLMMTFYNHAVVRYGIVVTIIIVFIIEREKLKKILQTFLNFRKNRSED